MKNISNDSIITVNKKDHGKDGKRALALNTLLKSKTVEAFKNTLTKLEEKGEARIRTYAGYALNFAVSEKLITLKTPKASKPAKAAKAETTATPLAA